MAVVEVLSEGERTVAKPDWSSVADAVGRVVRGHSMAMLLEAKAGAWLTITNAERYGVQVMAIEEGELGEKVLLNPGARLDLVAVKIGGLPQDEPECTLVSGPQASAAAVHFMETGKRSADLLWRDPLHVEREAKGRR